MKFTKEQIFDLMEDYVDKSVEPWRHGTRATYVVPFEGKFYRFTVDIHHDEGVQIWGAVEATEVYAKQETKIIYTTDFHCAPTSKEPDIDQDALQNIATYAGFDICEKLGVNSQSQSLIFPTIADAIQQYALTKK